MLSNIDLSTKTILVLGYAMTGKSVAEFLLKQQANIIINDRGDLSKDPSVALLIDKGVRVVDGGHPLHLFDEPIDMIVKNPGIPYSIPFLQRAQELEIPIYTDVEIASMFCEAPIIGITGSNGKTTTTSLIQQILSHREKGQSRLAGNIGVPTLEVVSEATKEDDVVMELSSFQLAGTQRFHPRIAVIVNIFEAHLDYHETRENYVESKLKILANQNSEDFVVYRYDQGELHDWVREYRGELVPFSVEYDNEFVKENGAYIDNQMIMFKGESILPLTSIQIPGEHNIENVLAAVAVAKLKGISNSQIEETVSNYQGMRHRIQPVLQTDGRKFFNDSKATNTVATITALKSFNQPIRYIGGGLDRGNEFDDLLKYINNVSAAYLYGETKQKMANVFEKTGTPKILQFDNLIQASTQAYRDALQGEVVLFSPACASWDQFKNFEIRGDVFVETIEHLVENEPYNREKKD
ncbi:UDP-N-acetylmuramoyl-L-alanine--D-glutamate ligase [Aerococcaceae bacterium WGS1372]